MFNFFKKRAFDSQTQKMRRPVQDPEKMRKLQQEFAQCMFSMDPTLTDPNRALALADLMITMEPERAVPWTCKCLALGALSRTSDALQAINRAIDIDPSDPDKWDIKASALSRLGRSSDAALAAKEAQRLRKL